MMVVVLLALFSLDTRVVALIQVPVDAAGEGAKQIYSHNRWASVNQRSTIMQRTLVDASILPEMVMRYYNPEFAEEARKILEKGVATGEENADNESIFKAVDMSFKLPKAFLNHTQNRIINRDGNKNIMNLYDSACVVYGAGIATDSTFEQEMANRGCEVHAFDCTLTGSENSVANKPFKFHPWCLGTPASFENNIYTGHENISNYEFKTLTQIMEELGHTKVDVLKFDIEGFEWQLFTNDLLQSSHHATQLSFELHTTKANPKYVPHNLVADKNYVAVNKLFLALYDLGYRVISKERNPGDSACAEFVLVNIDFSKLEKVGRKIPKAFVY